jgi:hypothetical protein
VPGAESRKRRRRYRKRPKEERDADEAIARLYALDRAERGPDPEGRKYAKIRDFALAYGVKPGSLVLLDKTTYRVASSRVSVGELGLETSLDLRKVKEPRSILGARADFLIIDDVLEPKK